MLELKFVVLLENFLKNMISLSHRFFKDCLFPEFNFWVFLIVSLCLDSYFQDAKLLVFFCVFSLAIPLLNSVWKMFQAFTSNLKFVILITFYLIVTFFFFPLLLWILPFLILRIQLSFLLLFAFFLFIFLIWAFQAEQVWSFSRLLEKFLPATLFLLLITSFSYSIYFFFKLPFLIWFFLFLGFNHIFLWELFVEEWTPMILRSSFLWNFFRFFLPLPLLEETLLIFLGADYMLSGLFGLIKLQGLGVAPRLSSSYQRFLKIEPKPRYFYTGWSTLYLNQVEKFSVFVEKHLSFLLEEFTKKDYPSATLKQLIKEIQVQNLEPFFKSNNFLVSREFLHLIVLQVFLINKVANNIILRGAKRPSADFE